MGSGGVNSGSQACRAGIIIFCIPRGQIRVRKVGIVSKSVLSLRKGFSQMVDLLVWEFGMRGRVGALEVGGQKGVKVWVRTPARGCPRGRVSPARRPGRARASGCPAAASQELEPGTVWCRPVHAHSAPRPQRTETPPPPLGSLASGRL